MYILSQDKTRIYNMSGHIEGIGYEESKDYKQRKTENIRHTIQVFDGCAEEIAEFKTKEDCMLVIYAIFKGMEQDSKAVEIPTQEDQSKQRESKVQHKEFGWLSPEGTFTESPFGTHEESAEMICERKGFVDEYWKWVKENGDNEIGHLMRDFLSEVKGYCLIHNPTGCGGYIVTNMKSLTKRQKEFLYGYFMDMGDRFKAEQFIKE